MKERVSVGSTRRSRNGPKPAVMLRKPCTGSECAEGHGDQDGEYDGRERDRDRGLDTLADHFQNGNIGDQGDAEVAVQQLVDPGEELDVDRLMQAERATEALKLFRSCIVAGENCGGIARR